MRPPHRIALLRAVNVGGTGKLPMAELREALAQAGLAEVRTVLASGNVLFSDPRAPEALEPLVEAVLRERFGLSSEVYVRTAEAWAALAEANPFPEAAAERPARLHLIVGREPADLARLEALRGVGPSGERIEAGDRALYLDYVDGVGESRLTPAWIASRLGFQGTARNWNTVLRLAALAPVD